MILQIDLISVNIYLYVYSYPITYTITSDIFVYISSSKIVYINALSMSIVYGYHLLINQISIMTRSLMSLTTGEYLSVNSTPVMWVYSHGTIGSLYQTSLFFLKTNLESIMRLFGGIFILQDLLHTPLFIISSNYFRIDMHQPSCYYES